MEARRGEAGVDDMILPFDRNFTRVADGLLSIRASKVRSSVMLTTRLAWNVWRSAVKLAEVRRLFLGRL